MKYYAKKHRLSGFETLYHEKSLDTWFEKLSLSIEYYNTLAFPPKHKL